LADRLDEIKQTLVRGKKLLARSRATLARTAERLGEGGRGGGEHQPGGGETGEDRAGSAAPLRHLSQPGTAD
jgi:hypothetical protein